MAEKRKSDISTRKAMSDLIKIDSQESTADAWLSFSKWFEYQDPNLDSVHNSPSEIESLNNKKVSKFVWEDLSSYNLDKKERDKTIDSWDLEKSKVAAKMLDEWYSNEAIIAYIDNWDKRENPNASWTWKFEKKWSETDSGKSRSSTIKRWWWTLGTLLGLEWWGTLLEKKWKSIYTKAMWENKKDVLKDIRYKKNSELAEFYRNKWEKVQAQIDDLIQKWWDEDQLKALQGERDRLAKLEEQHTKIEPKSTAEVANEYGLAWWDRELAKEAWVEKTKLFSEEIEPYINKSEKKFKISDFLDDLKYEDFSDVNEFWWKEYQDVIEEMKNTPAYSEEKTLKELYDWKKRTWLSNASLKWNESKEVVRNIQDKLYTKVNNAIKTTLDTENPWVWLWQKISDYWLLTEVEEDTTKAAQSAARAKPSKPAATTMELAGKMKDKITSSKSFKTKLGKVLQKIGKGMKPSTWISKINKLVSHPNPWVVDVVWILQLGTLLPWPSWDAFREAVETMPAAVAEEKLFEPISVALSRSSFNKMTDDERIDGLKQFYDYMYWEDIPREDVSYTYYKWKWNSKWDLHEDFNWGNGTFKQVWWERNEPLPMIISNEDDDIAYENSRMRETEYKILYENAKTDWEKVNLIMKRYLVDEDKAKEMLKYVDAWWTYNNEERNPGLEDDVMWIFDLWVIDELMDIAKTEKQKELLRKLRIEEMKRKWLYKEA